MLLDKFAREYDIYQIDNYNSKTDNEMTQEDLGINYTINYKHILLFIKYYQ